MILQTAGQGRYVSPLLHKRYQILESVISKTMFYVVDHQLPGDLIIRDKKGDILHFEGIESAKSFLKGRVSGRRTVSQKGQPVVEPVGGKESLAAFIRRSIRAGLRNEEITQRAIAEKGMAPSRTSIVDWYRRKMKDGE